MEQAAVAHVEDEDAEIFGFPYSPTVEGVRGKGAKFLLGIKANSFQEVATGDMPVSLAFVAPLAKNREIQGFKDEKIRCLGVTPVVNPPDLANDRLQLFIVHF